MPFEIWTKSKTVSISYNSPIILSFPRKETKENKLADALKAITGNPDVEDAYVEAANYMRNVRTDRDTLEKEASVIPGLETRIQQLQGDLGMWKRSLVSGREGSVDFNDAF